MSNQVGNSVDRVLFIFNVPLYCLWRRINVVNTNKKTHPLQLKSVI